MSRLSIVKWPTGIGSAGKGLGNVSPLVKWPAAPGAASFTHPGFSAVIPSEAGKWDRELLDLTSLGSAVATGLSVRAKPVVCQMLDLVIWANGIDAVQVYNPTSRNVYDLGVSAPAAAPALADQGSGSFTGEYTYAYRYKRSDTGEFSALSDLAQHSASGSGASIRVTIVASAGTGVDQVEIFRSKNGHTGLYKIATQADTTLTYDDSTADSAIDITLVAPPRPAPGGDASIPVFQNIIPYSGRLWGMIDNTVYWSEPFAPWLFPATNSTKVAPQDRDTCTGFAVAGGILYIGKERHTYYVANTDSMGVEATRGVLTPDIRLMDDSTGFASQHAARGIENQLIFMSGEGKMYRSAGGGEIAQEMAPLLEKTLQRLYVKRLSEVEIGYAEKERKVLVSCSLDESVYNDTMLALDLTTQGWVKYGIEAESLAEFRDSDGRGRLVLGNVRGDVNQLGISYGHGARSGTLSGTLTGATKNTLTDSTAAFNASCAGWPIHLFNAKWELIQKNMVASRDSATALTTVWPWAPIPNTSNTWYYVLGGIFPEWRFGWFDLAEWGIVQEMNITYVPGRGNLGVYHAVDDHEDELVGVVNLAGRGRETLSLHQGSRRFRTTLKGFDGASILQLLSLEWVTA